MSYPSPETNQTKNLGYNSPELRLLEASKAPPLPYVLEQIMWCESRGRQYDKNGKPLRGVHYFDVGKYQINIKVWGEEANRLGYDLFSEEGNEAMALELYNRFGTRPWTSSQHCWKDSFVLAD